MNSNQTKLDPGDPESALERATADRLARLRTLPVDTSRLEGRLMAALPELRKRLEKSSMSSAVETRSHGFWLRIKPLRAVAAALLVLGAVVAVLITSSTGPAMASPGEMAKVHYDLIAENAVSAVDSIEAANKALADHSSGASPMPDHMMACCMKSLARKQVACVLMKIEGSAVTISVAKASDMKLPQSETISRGGQMYHVQNSGKLNMVMTQKQERWICLIGELPAGRLAELAEQIRF